MTRDEKQKVLEALELAHSGSTSTHEVRTYNAAIALVRADLERPEDELRTKIADYLYGHTREYAESIAKADKWDSKAEQADAILALIVKP